MYQKAYSLLASGAVGALLLLRAAPGLAVNCADISATLPHPVYGTGGSAITADLKLIAAALSELEDPITILYSDDGGACTSYGYYHDGSAASPYKYWTVTYPAGVRTITENKCDAPEVAPQFAHLGNPVDLCPDAEDWEDPNVKDFGGPVQTLNLITHKTATFNSISAEALYFIYGWGPNAAGVDPWTVDLGVFVRQSDSFASLFLADAININPESLYGLGTAQQKAKQIDVITGIVAAAATDADSTLGFVSGSAADASKDVKTLAFQAYDQSCGYWPDSKPGKLDKINVRTGLYDLWTPGHFYAEKDSNGDPADPDVANLISWIAGESLGPEDLDVTRLVIEAGDIPLCAMRVNREGLRGGIFSYQDDKPCECYFESIATKKVPARCDACADDDGCTGDAPFCNYGFCEAYRKD
jgi:hypothetical protein